MKLSLSIRLRLRSSARLTKAKYFVQLSKVLTRKKEVNNMKFCNLSYELSCSMPYSLK